MFNRACEPFRAGGVGAAGIGGVVGSRVGNKDENEGQEDEAKKLVSLGDEIKGKRDKVSLDVGVLWSLRENEDDSSCCACLKLPLLHCARRYSGYGRPSSNSV